MASYDAVHFFLAKRMSKIGNPDKNKIIFYLNFSAVQSAFNDFIEMHLKCTLPRSVFNLNCTLNEPFFHSFIIQMFPFSLCLFSNEMK